MLTGAVVLCIHRGKTLLRQSGCYLKVKHPEVACAESEFVLQLIYPVVDLHLYSLCQAAFCMMSTLAHNEDEQLNLAIMSSLELPCKSVLMSS